MLKGEFYSKKRDFIVIFVHSNKTNRVMKTLLVFKNIEKRTVKALYFNSAEKAFSQQGNWPCNKEWKMIYFKNREKSGHRYEIMYARVNEDGELNSKYIVCFTKKEALYLKTKILEVYPYYRVQIRKIY